MFKFKVGEDIKVSALGEVYKGKITSRHLVEDLISSRINYTIEFCMGGGLGISTVEVGEKHLVETQLLEVGYE